VISIAAAASGVAWRAASTTDQRVFGNTRGASLGLPMQPVSPAVKPVVGCCAEFCLGNS